MGRAVPSIWRMNAQSEWQTVDLPHLRIVDQTLFGQVAARMASVGGDHSTIMAKMTKNQLIDAIAEGTQVSKGDVKAVIEQMATVGYKELNETGEFVVPGFVKMSVVNKLATEAPQRRKFFHRRTYGVRGQAGKQVGKGAAAEGC
jgi:nucleoid DNA-binding protein